MEREHLHLLAFLPSFDAFELFLIIKLFVNMQDTASIDLKSSPCTPKVSNNL